MLWQDTLLDYNTLFAKNQKAVTGHCDGFW